MQKSVSLCVFIEYLKYSQLPMKERSNKGHFKVKNRNFILCCITCSTQTAQGLVRGKVLTVIPCNPWKDLHNGPIQVGFLSPVSRWDA